jgi:hypothetical protein
MHVVERGVRWDKQKLVVDAAKIQVLNSLAIAFNIGTGASVARKRAHLGEFKARVAAYKTGVNKLNHPSMTTEHMNVIIEGRVEYKVWELKITPLEKELEEIWAKQYQATNEVYESAKAVKEQREDNAPTVTLRDFVAQYLKEINFLKTMEYTAAEKDKVIEHQANYRKGTFSCLAIHRKFTKTIHSTVG